MRPKIKMFLASMALVLGSLVVPQGAIASVAAPAPKGPEGTSGPAYNPSPRLSGGKDNEDKRNEALIGEKTYKNTPPTNLGNKAKGGVTTMATACSPYCHEYVTMYQYTNPGGTTPITGMGMRQEVGTPTVRPWDASGDGFSLMQNAVINQAGSNIVEAGWVVQGPFSDAKPRFFVSAWNGSHVGWGTGFVPVSSPIMSHGTDLSTFVGDGVGFRTHWDYFDTSGCGGCEGWWLSYAKAVGDPLTYIGHYPASLWGAFGNFDGADVDLVQGFSEIAVSQTPSQTGMGQNSILTANRLGSSAFGLSGLSAPAPSWSKDTACTTTCDFSKWDGSVLSATSFNVGGPGGFEDILSTTAPSADDCSGEGTGTNPSGLGAVCLYDTAVGVVPQGKLFQIDASAGTTCRTNLGGTGVSNVALTGVKRATFFATNNCTGTGYQANHGRVALPAGYSNQAAFSYRVDSTYATCATGWPTTAPTC